MKQLFFLTALVLILASCKKDRGEETATTPNIHICGSVTNTALNNRYACYWKNGVATPLTSATATGTDAEALDMAVYNNDVYIVGGEENSSGRGVGKYWKNGTLVTTFDDGVNNIICQAIAVNANGVHMAINQQSNAGLPYTYTPKYWKDGTLTTLQIFGGAANAILTDIVTSGTDVYILGMQAGSTIKTCILWKNGSPTIIPLTNINNASNYKLAVSGNDVYIVTNEYPVGSNVSRVMLYKNNDAGQAITSTTNAGSKEVLVSGSDLYIAGLQFDANATITANYWKNGTKVTLNSSATTPDSELTSICVKNEDVFTCGITYVNNVSIATYWKNGVATRLINGTLSSYPTKIIVE